MYSCCRSHALRNKIEPGSILFFVYGDRSAMRAGKRTPLYCDTVFVVEHKRPWDRRDAAGEYVTDIPTGLEPYRQSAWHAHLKWPLDPYFPHRSVAYTYLAKNVEQCTDEPFSFLPYARSGRESFIPVNLEPLILDHWSDVPKSKEKRTPGLAIAGGRGRHTQPIEMPHQTGISLYRELRGAADLLVLRILSQGKAGIQANC